jgi:hypothetical protein
MYVLRSCILHILNRTRLTAVLIEAVCVLLSCFHLNAAMVLTLYMTLVQ